MTALPLFLLLVASIAQAGGIPKLPSNGQDSAFAVHAPHMTDLEEDPSQQSIDQEIPVRHFNSTIDLATEISSIDQEPTMTVDDALMMALSTALVMPLARSGGASADFGDLDWSLPVHNISKRADFYRWIPELLNDIFDSGRTVNVSGQLTCQDELGIPHYMRDTFVVLYEKDWGGFTKVLSTFDSHDPINITRADAEGRFELTGYENELWGEHFFLKIEIECDSKLEWQQKCLDVQFLEQCRGEAEPSGFIVAHFFFDFERQIFTEEQTRAEYYLDCALGYKGWHETSMGNKYYTTSSGFSCSGGLCEPGSERCNTGLMKKKR